MALPRRIQFLKIGEGDGTPIIFIHGFGGDLNNWLFTQPALSDGRITYAVLYMKSPEKRFPGMMITFIAQIVLLLGALIGVGMRLF